MHAPGAWTVRATARPAAGTGGDELRPLGAALVADASTRWTAEPAARAQAAVDGDLLTAWWAAPEDQTPTLRLRWPGRRTLTSLRLVTPAGLAASRPARVELRSGRTTRTADVGADGRVRFAPLTGTSLDITVLTVSPQRAVDAVQGFTTLPVAVSEVVVPGLELLRRGPDPAARAAGPCGSGPALVVGDRRLATRVEGTVGDRLRRAPLTVLPCDARAMRLPAGSVRVTLEASDRWEPESVTLTPAVAGRALPGPAPVTPARASRWDAEQRAVDVDAAEHDRVLVVHENANPGWRAQLAGRELRTVRLDGWQQGWVVPAGAGGRVDLEFTPGLPYRAGLLAGAALLVALTLAALLRPWRRRPAAVAAADERRIGARARTARLGALAAAAGIVVACGWLGLGAVVVVAIVARLAPGALPALGLSATVGAALASTASARADTGAAALVAAALVAVAVGAAVARAASPPRHVP
jgi:arabinofuranan 3-O-arabinosyltransferase